MSDTELRLLLSINETQKALGNLGRTSVYNLINAGELEVRHIGSRSFVTVESARRVAAKGANTKPPGAAT